MDAGLPTDGESYIDILKMGIQNEARDAGEKGETQDPTCCEGIPTNEGNRLQPEICAPVKTFGCSSFSSPRPFYKSRRASGEYQERLPEWTSR